MMDLSLETRVVQHRRRFAVRRRRDADLRGVIRPPGYPFLRVADHPPGAGSGPPTRPDCRKLADERAKLLDALVKPAHQKAGQANEVQCLRAVGVQIAVRFWIPDTRHRPGHNLHVALLLISVRCSGKGRQSDQRIVRRERSIHQRGSVEFPAVGISYDPFDSIIELLERGLHCIAEKPSFKSRSCQSANPGVNKLPKPLIWALGLFDIRSSKESPRFRNDKALKDFK